LSYVSFLEITGHSKVKVVYLIWITSVR